MHSTEASSSVVSSAFTYVIEYPKITLLLALLLIVCLGSGVLFIQKDPSVDAFVSDEYPAAIARAKASELFGIEDPIVVGIVSSYGQSAFTVRNITALRQLESDIQKLSNVKKNELISVLSDKAISSAEGDLVVEPLLSAGPLDKLKVEKALKRIQTIPMLIGLLTTKTGDVLTLIVPLIDANNAVDTYKEILALTNNDDLDLAKWQVAGVAAKNGRLGETVGHDTRIFIHFAVLTALVILYFSLMSWRGIMAPMLVISGSAIIAIGVMGWLGSRYYLITTSLPVIIMAISIADSLHISTVLIKKRQGPIKRDLRASLLETMCDTFVPVTYTSLTTIVGFLGLAIVSSTQPIVELGLYASVGVVAAWVLSLTLLPAIVCITKFSDNLPNKNGSSVSLSLLISQLTQNIFSHPQRSFFYILVSIVCFSYFATQIKFDYERQRFFQPIDAVRIADPKLNSRLGGLNFLDVIVTNPDERGLITSDATLAIDQLQQKLLQQEHVEKITSIVDYIALMHPVLNDTLIDRLPVKNNTAAQYILLYEASGNPDDFANKIDYQYKNVLMRSQLTTDQYSEIAGVVKSYIDITEDWSQKTGLKASVGGRAAVNAGWMSLLEQSHAIEFVLAMVLVFGASLFAFKAFWPALICLIPLSSGVLFTYAILGFLSIDIAPTTLMTSAISNGIGVDFAKCKAPRYYICRSI
jgi:uncharacterized protein